MRKPTRESPEAPSTLAIESPILLGKRADELSGLIEQQFVPIFEAQGIVVPVRSCSLLLHIEQAESASAADLAKALDQSHQLVLQKIPALLERKLIRRRSDPNDGRRRVFSLTPKGRRQVALLARHSAVIVQIYHDLYAEIGVDLFAAIGRALDALKERNLSARFTDTV